MRPAASAPPTPYAITTTIVVQPKIIINDNAYNINPNDQIDPSKGQIIKNKAKPPCC